jgi:GT2 family glycosyltransferase
MSPELSVIICSFNGGQGTRRCLHALAAQTISSNLEVIVVDDGSTDSTSGIARAHGALLIRHPVNRGIAAARNSGVAAASAPIVGFLDDDCEPEPEWAERLLAHYTSGITGMGGPILPEAPASFMRGYLKRHNPLRPQEINLAKSDRLIYRFYLYLQRQWFAEERNERREVSSLTGANMSFRRQALLEIGRFDERFQFGAEEVDLCRRLSLAAIPSRLIFNPDVRVTHHFQATLRDTLRRSRAYGRGSARLYRKWPELSPTFFPGPVAVLLLLTLSMFFPLLLIVMLALPYLLYPHTIRGAISRRRCPYIADAYVQLAQETCEDIGFLEGLWRCRHFAPEPPARGHLSACRRSESEGSP